jgi:hypothetical protein
MGFGFILLGSLSGCQTESSSVQDPLSSSSSESSGSSKSSESSGSSEEASSVSSTKEGAPIPPEVAQEMRRLLKTYESGNRGQWEEARRKLLACLILYMKRKRWRLFV